MMKYRMYHTFVVTLPLYHGEDGSLINYSFLYGGSVKCRAVDPDPDPYKVNADPQPWKNAKTLPTFGTPGGLNYFLNNNF